MASSIEQLPQLLEMEQRLNQDGYRYTLEERKYRWQWVALEGVILAIGFLTPVIVAYRKSGLYPVEFWVWWCTLTPPITAGCAILMRVSGVQDKCLINRRKIKRMHLLLGQVNLEIPLCEDDEKATQLLRTWHKDAHKIELDA